MRNFTDHARHVAHTTLRRFGFDLVRNVEPPLARFLEHRRVDTVLDVGANTGEFAESLRAMGYRGDIVSFEPVRRTFGIVKEKTKSDPRWHVQNVALGDVAGPADINVSEHSNFSSLLTLTEAAHAFSSHAAVEHVETIDVRKLDDMFAPFEGKNVFLKIDTQGFEQRVLEGARRSLEHICGLLLELPIVHLYENTWTFREALAYLENAGFVLSQVQPTNYLTVDPVSIVELDCVFRRRDVNIDGIAAQPHVLA